MKYSLKRKRTVALLWLAAYAALLIIPFFGNLYILLSVNSAVKHETESKYRYFLKSLSTNIDSALKTVIVTGNIIQESAAVNKLAEATEITPQILYDLAQLGKEMRKTTDRGDFVESFVYYPRIDKIVTSQNYYDAKDYFESDVLHSGEEYENYKGTLKKQPYDGVIKTTQKDEKGKEKDVFVFMSAIGQNYNLKYVIGITVDVKGLFGTEFDENNGEVAVLKQRGDIYFSTNADLTPAELDTIKGMKPFETRKINIQGKDAGISYVGSEISNYKYVYIDHAGYVYTAANKIMLIGAGVSLICLVLMGMILYRLYGWSYLSLKEIMQGFNAGGDVRCDENEFEFIKRQIKLNMQRQRTMEEEINNHIEILREEFLIELMRGSINDSVYIEEGFRKNNITFKGKYFCITVIYVRDMGILRDVSLKNTYFIIKNIMSDICRGETYYSAEYGDRLYCIFNFEQNANIHQHLRTLLNECGEVTKTATEIVFFSVTSEVGVGLESLHHLYESAGTGVNLSEFYGMDEHIFKEDIETMYAEPDAEYLGNTENEIIMCIKTGDEENLKTLLDRLFADQIALNHRWVVMGRAYSVLNSIFKIIDGLDNSSAKEAFDKLNSFREYDNIGSIKAFVYEYGVYAMKILDSSSEEKSELYQKAVEYINNHYTEADLNVNKVGEELGVTSIYLAYVVKQNSGMKLSEYIAKLRIETAKELLESDHDMKIEQIAEKSGFWQNRTFYNTFKKYTGLTPTQYRNLNKGE